MTKNVQIYHLSEPLQDATTAKIDINTVDGNMKIDALSGGTELASGTLQYLENQEPPTRSVSNLSGQTNLTINSGRKGQTWLRLPWSTCNGATVWDISLNPTISIDLVTHSGGGNVQLDLTKLTVTHLKADTGGGNMEVFLPDNVRNMSVEVKSGAGNVTVHLPSSVAARVHATSGLGKVVAEGPFNQIDKNTYQSPDYDSAIDKVEINASSGAGNVIIKERHPQTTAMRI